MITVKPGYDLSKKIHASVGFYMSDSGKRKIVLPKIDRVDVPKLMTNSSVGQECLFWADGDGPFPEGFRPNVDTLGPMLRKIVDIQMGLEKGENDET